MRTVLVLIRIETSTESFQRIQRMTPRTRTRTSQQNSTSSANETATACRHLGMFWVQFEGICSANGEYYVCGSLVGCTFLK